MEHNLQVEYRSPDDLTPYARNARTHSPEQVAQIAGSIREFGFTNPILTDENGTIIAGHGRLAAAQKLGLKKVPCITIAGLTDTQRRALILADNRLAETAGWDAEMLRVELEELTEMGADLDLIGFDEESLDELIGGLEDEHTEGDTEPEDPPATPVSRRGDVWQLGKHRLMCGDATSAEDVAKLMGGEKAEICFTSPPYNMMATNHSWNSAPRKAMGAGLAYNENEQDNKTDEQYADMLKKAGGNALSVCDDALFNIGILAGSKKGIIALLAEYVDNFCEVIVWNKTQSMPVGMGTTRGLVSHRSELVFCFNQTGSRAFTHPQWDKGTGLNCVSTNNASTNQYAKQHAATFPVEFAEHFCRNFCGQSILDLFCGTGTTIIAAENTGRRAYGMELAPAYVDISIKRWQQHTGQQATLNGKTFDEIAAERAHSAEQVGNEFSLCR